jgi:Putative transposase
MPGPPTRGSQQRLMTLAATEFLRRFFLQVLPKGFVRIRHFGFLANRFRSSQLELSRQLLASEDSRIQLGAVPNGDAPSGIVPTVGR